MLDIKLVYRVFEQIKGYEGYKGWVFVDACYVVRNSVGVCSSSAFSRAFYSSVAIASTPQNRSTH